MVGEKLAGLIKTLPAEEQALFRSHSRGSFDFRVDKIVQFVGGLRYIRAGNVEGRCPDAWLFPDETLEQGGGDCEDLAFLLAALLMAAGVTGYCLRVALGTLRIRLPRGQVQNSDHCWVMYQNESGRWEILEPMSAVASASVKKKLAGPSPEVSLGYEPHYVFNTDHLWLIRSRHLNPKRGFDDYCGRRSFWGKFDPTFAAGVHASIFDAALGKLAPAEAISAMKRKSLLMDGNILTYDPRDHFDNGYIPEGWGRINEELAAFKKNPTDWSSFGAAGHTIADFYAHTSYAHFAELQNAAAVDGQAVLYEPGEGLVAPPAYGSTPARPALSAFNLESGPFSRNTAIWQGTGQQAAASWAGKVISGRYAQLHDPKASFFEGFTSIPRDLAAAPGFAVRGSLPHHDEIAVDGDAPAKRHVLYSAKPAPADERNCFANQFRWRRNAAIAHLRKAFQENCGK